MHKRLALVNSERYIVNLWFWWVCNLARRLPFNSFCLTIRIVRVNRRVGDLLTLVDFFYG